MEFLNKCAVIIEKVLILVCYYNFAGNKPIWPGDLSRQSSKLHSQLQEAVVPVLGDMEKSFPGYWAFSCLGNTICYFALSERLQVYRHECLQRCYYDADHCSFVFCYWPWKY